MDNSCKHYANGEKIEKRDREFFVAFLEYDVLHSVECPKARNDQVKCESKRLNQIVEYKLLPLLREINSYVFNSPVLWHFIYYYNISD